MADRDTPPPTGRRSTEDLTPVPAHRSPTVVGIGASAGGLAALRTFFTQVPEDAGLAYVVVVHLSPEHESHLADLLQPYARIPVMQVTETTTLEPDRVYVIPPGANLSAVDTHLSVTPMEASPRLRAPIDHFFRTLAATHDGHSVGVVLTGTGSDGALGIKAIEERHGFVVVQDPAEAEFDGMPQSAIATGLVDLVLPLERIPEAVLRFDRTDPRVAVPTDEQSIAASERQLLHRVVAKLRARTGRDFGGYRPSTLLRRIQRRMQMVEIEEPERYLERLHEDPDEARALADDVLINVTTFFRDPEVWQYLEQEVIPGLFEGKGPDDRIRVWSVGCATGEEAYTLTMLLMEAAAGREAPPQIQVFASDLHEQSIGKARDGFYPGDVAADVSAERLRRFFRRENGGYCVKKEVRERVVFTPHNLLGDPPFSRLELIVCRNLMIYLQRDVQGEVLEIFHYALRSGGALLLGSAESVDGSELFTTVHKPSRLYRRRNVRLPGTRLPVFTRAAASPPRDPADPAERAAVPLDAAALHRRMLVQGAPPSLLVAPDGCVARFGEGVGRYLVHPGGDPTTHVLKLVREELRIELRTALHQARQTGSPARSRPIAFVLDGQRIAVSLEARPPREPEAEAFALIVFDEHEAPAERADGPAADRAPEGAAAAVHAREMEEEVHLTRKRLQAAIEQYETTQEEMRASHEELQSMNEELRSTLEELETSKEELQSMNEELQTVNQENRHRVEELSQLAGDLQNLLAATQIATIFLDRGLRILRYTPAVAEIFNVRPVDRGRPLSDLTHRLGYANLQADAVRVLRTLIPVEREVEDQQGRWYLTRVLPYRSADDRIEGVVITLVDITRRREAELVLRENEERQSYLLELGDALRPLADPVEIQRAAMRVLGERLKVDRALYSEIDEESGEFSIADNYVRADFPKMSGRFPLSDFGDAADVQRAGRTLVVSDIETADATEAQLDAYRAVGANALVGVPLRKEGRWVASLTVHQGGPRTWTNDEVELISETAERTWASVERARAEERLRESEEKYRTLFTTMDEAYAVVEPIADEDGRWVDFLFHDVNPAFLAHTGMEHPVGRTATALLGTPDPQWAEHYGRVATTGEPLRMEMAEPLLDRTFDLNIFRLGGPDERRVAVLFTDVTGRKRAEEELRRAKNYAESIVETLHEPLLILHPDLRVGNANEAFYESFQVRRGETEGRLVFELGNGQWDIPALRTLLEDVLPENRVFNDYEVTHVFDDIGERVMLLNARRIESVEFILLGIRDITARKRAEYALRESEERHRLIVESARDYGILTIDAGGRITGWSPGAAAVYGWSADEAIGRDVSITFTEEDRAGGVPERDRALAREGGSATDVRWHLRRDGSYVFIEGVTRLLEDHGGGVRGYLKIGQDVTRRREVEEALRASEAHLAAIFAQAAVGLAELAPDGRFLRVNDELCRILGRTREELLRSSALDVTHPEDVASSRSVIRRAIERGETVSLDKRYLRPDGAEVWANSTVTRIADHRERTGSLLAVTADLTLRRQAETVLREMTETLERRVDEGTRQVREQEERLRTLVETAALTIWTTDADGRVVDDSPTWRSHTGQTIEQLLGEGWAAAVHPDDAAFAVENWRHAVEERVPLDTEYRLWHAQSASWRWTNMRAVPISGEDGGLRGWIGMNIDIEARRRAEEARREVLRQLVDVEETERRRISRELHDQMGQQVTGLLLGLRALGRMAPTEHAEKAAELEQVATNIARDMQTLALELRPPSLDMLGLVAALQSHFEEWAERHGLEPDFHARGLADERLPTEVETTLYRILQEGLTNVIKHAGATRVSLLLERRGAEVRAILEDDGDGFDVEGTLASPEKARRLGLRGMRERVALLSGELQIESTPGDGATLFVRIPVGSPPPQGGSDAEQP